MHKTDLDEMPFDDLWLLHEEVTKVLSEKIRAEKLELEKRLAQLAPSEARLEVSQLKMGADRARRPYRKVPAKYLNPVYPNETWSGRGKQPRWLNAALQSGHKIEEFEIKANEKEADEPT